MKKIKLSPRLAAVASFVNNCKTVADIGTDHGFIPVHLIQNGICEGAIASDIRQGPLSSAVRTAQEYGVSDKISFVCAPGLDGVEQGSVDTVIIAGMGGETIMGILNAAPWVKENSTHLVLQPQSKLDYLEEYLGRNRFCVENAKLVKDAGRIYLVLSVRYSGLSEQYNGAYFTERLRDDPLLEEYVSGLLKKLLQRKEGILSGNVANRQDLDDINIYINELSSLLREG